MGTNYYVVKNLCKCCGRKDEEHIGKSSIGWTFTFQGNESVRNFDQWLANIKSAILIQDEYGKDIVLDDLLALIEAKRGAPNNHTLYCQEHYEGIRASHVWLDSAGNSFSEGDWS